MSRLEYFDGPPEWEYHALRKIVKQCRHQCELKSCPRRLGCRYTNPPRAADRMPGFRVSLSE
jgi:hypothetical protein